MSAADCREHELDEPSAVVAQAASPRPRHFRVAGSNQSCSLCRSDRANQHFHEMMRHSAGALADFVSAGHENRWFENPNNHQCYLITLLVIIEL